MTESYAPRNNQNIRAAMSDLMTGYYECVGEMHSADHDTIRTALSDYLATGDKRPVVIREGLTLVWHDLPRITEERIRAEAVAAERERIHAAVLALTPHVFGVPMVTVYEVIGTIDGEDDQ